MTKTDSTWTWWKQLSNPHMQHWVTQTSTCTYHKPKLPSKLVIHVKLDASLYQSIIVNLDRPVTYQTQLQILVPTPQKNKSRTKQQEDKLYFCTHTLSATPKVQSSYMMIQEGNPQKNKSKTKKQQQQDKMYLLTHSLSLCHTQSSAILNNTTKSLVILNDTRKKPSHASPPWRSATPSGLLHNSFFAGSSMLLDKPKTRNTHHPPSVETHLVNRPSSPRSSVSPVADIFIAFVVAAADWRLHDPIV